MQTFIFILLLLPYSIVTIAIHCIYLTTEQHKKVTTSSKSRRNMKHVRIKYFLKRWKSRTPSKEGRTTSSLAFLADVWDGGPFGERCCQPRQTAAPGSAPDLTEASPSISHVIGVSQGVCALLAVILTRRHKLFLSRCSLMHLSLIPPPYNNTKANTCLPCSNYTGAHTHKRTWMCIVRFTKWLVNVKQHSFTSLSCCCCSCLLHILAGWGGCKVGGTHS